MARVEIHKNERESGRMDRLKTAFDYLDKAGDGVVSLSELQSLMQKLDPSLSKTAIKNMLKAVDVNGNGALDFEEFVSILNSI